MISNKDTRKGMDKMDCIGCGCFNKNGRELCDDCESKGKETRVCGYCEEIFITDKMHDLSCCWCCDDCLDEINNVE